MTWWNQIKEDLATLAPVGLSFALLLVCGLAMSTLGWRLQSASATETGLFLGLILGPVFAPAVGRWKKAEEPVQPQAQTLYPHCSARPGCSLDGAAERGQEGGSITDAF
jgi:hypothetical protein